MRGWDHLGQDSDWGLYMRVLVCRTVQRERGKKIKYREKNRYGNIYRRPYTTAFRLFSYQGKNNMHVHLAFDGRY